MQLVQARARLATAIELRATPPSAKATALFLSLIQDLDGAIDPELRLVLAEATVELGYLLAEQGHADFAVRAFDRVITPLEDVGAVAIRAAIAKGDVLRTTGQSAAAVDCYTLARDRARAWLDRQPVVAPLLANALMQLAQNAAAQGYTDEAVAAYDEIVARLKPLGLEMHVAVIHARYNRAVVLRDAGRAEAILAYRTIVDDDAASTDVAVQRFAAMAAYNLGLHLVTGCDAQGAVDTFEAMVGHFGASTDLAVRQRLAKGLYRRLAIYSEARDWNTTVQACAEQITRFADDQDDIIQRTVAGARRRRQLILGWGSGRFYGASVVADLNPTLRLYQEGSGSEHIHHVLNVIDYPDLHTSEEPLTLGEVLQAVNGPRYEAPPDEAPGDQAFAARRSLFIAQLERDLAGHLQCADILAAYMDYSAPFSLYLRNFEFEGYVAAGVDAGRAIRANLQFAGDERFESQLAETLGGSLPLLGVGNNAPLRPDVIPTIPRMMLSNDGWQAMVEELMRAASTIVMHVSRLTQGVLWEIKALQRCGANDRTVVVLSTPAEVEGVQAIAMAFYGANPTPGPPVTKETPELAPFHRVIRDTELTGAVSDQPWASDLIARVSDTRTLPPDARTRWDGVVF